MSMIFLLYLLAIIALAISTANVYMAVIKQFPVQWLYYHYFFRKPLVWAIFVGTIVWIFWVTWQTGTFPLWSIIPSLLMGLALVLTYKIHQENLFQAVDLPVMTENISDLPIRDEMRMAVVEYGGITKAYPLNYIAHHHIINDRFGDYIVALTYCGMCHTIISFDVTDIGYLFVGSFKNLNMIVADRKTKTFFQQATFESIIGKLHPYSLTMIPSQTLSWSEVKDLNPVPHVAKVTEKDVREFQPMAARRKKTTSKEKLRVLQNYDQTFPWRTHVIGIIDQIANSQVVYLKEELMKYGVVTNEELKIFLVAVNNTVNGFKINAKDRALNITLTPKKTLYDSLSGTVWDIRGKQISGEIELDLEPIALSDEYWFSWKKFHPTSKLIRL